VSGRFRFIEHCANHQRGVPAGPGNHALESLTVVIPALNEEEAIGDTVQRCLDVVLGSRMGPQSKMPAIRRLGNKIYALILGLLCSHSITDTASGMRVVRRTSLDRLYPLPDGLHFTPSMSARALMNNLHVEEVPMSYSERIGRSKLSVVKDGVRFLQTILAGVLCYRPDKIFLTGVTLCVLAILVLGLHPLEHFRNTGSLEEWMIYRFAACSVAGLTALSLLYATAVINRMAELGLARKPAGE
jgi:hypothetical protein